MILQLREDDSSLPCMRLSGCHVRTKSFEACCARCLQTRCEAALNDIDMLSRVYFGIIIPTPMPDPLNLHPELSTRNL